MSLLGATIDPMFEPFKGLIAFSRRVAETPNGAGSYDFYKEGFEDKTVVKKDAVWDTVGLYGAQWRIVAVEIEGDKSASGVEWVKTELYLGKNVSNGYEITQRQFSNFLDKVVTKHFPKGITVCDSYGQMQEPDKTITEQATWVIAIIHEKTPENEKGIQTVIDEYRKQFRMSEVMRATSPAAVQFYTQE